MSGGAVGTMTGVAMAGPTTTTGVVGLGGCGADPDIKAGEYLMLDIQTNPGRIGLTKSTTYSHFLQITDAVSRLTVLLGLASVLQQIFLKHYYILLYGSNQMQPFMLGE